MTSKPCNLCESRRANQQEWKTEDEKRYCLTCWSFLKTIDTIEHALNAEAKSKGINKQISIIL